MVRYYLILLLILTGCATNSPQEEYEIEVDNVEYEKFHYYDFDTFEWKNVYYEKGEK
mgnify:CR=1 FL=1